MKFANITYIQGDLNNFENCQRAVEGVDAIQHLGAQPNPVDHPDLRAGAAENGIPFVATFRTNMLGTYYLMQAGDRCRCEDCRDVWQQLRIRTRLPYQQNTHSNTLPTN